MRRRWMMFAATMVAANAGLTFACTHEHEEAEFTDGCGSPSYGGAATDETFEAMVDAYGDATDTADKVTVTAPTADEAIAASGSAPTFAWTSPLALGAPRPGGMRFALVRRAPPRPWLEGAWEAAKDFVVGTAHAHLPPVTGDIYFIEVKVAGTACPVARALTTDLSWTPDAATWTALKATNGAPLELVVTSAYLSDNRVQEGPFRAASGVAFKVQ